MVDHHAVVATPASVGTRAPVRSLLVVDVDEAVDLGLELGQGRRGGLLAQPFLQGEVIALDLALGLGR